jgi:hypothetical protein
METIRLASGFPIVLPGITSMQFPPTSRYHGMEVATLTTDAGGTVVYLSRRFVPPPERFTVVQIHHVVQGERLDTITARYLLDPEQFWRICDANRAMRPEDLATTGRQLRITLPEGIPGVRDV